MTDIDIVFIPHVYNPSYEGLKAILNNGIQRSEVYFNIPDKEFCGGDGSDDDCQNVLFLKALIMVQRGVCLTFFLKTSPGSAFWIRRS